MARNVKEGPPRVDRPHIKGGAPLGPQRVDRQHGHLHRQVAEALRLERPGVGRARQVVGAVRPPQLAGGRARRPLRRAARRDALQAVGD
eukprot:2670381-Prymnesium_polylepis.1